MTGREISPLTRSIAFFSSAGLRRNDWMESNSKGCCCCSHIHSCCRCFHPYMGGLKGTLFSYRAWLKGTMNILVCAGLARSFSLSSRLCFLFLPELFRYQLWIHERQDLLLRHPARFYLFLMYQPPPVSRNETFLICVPPMSFIALFDGWNVTKFLFLLQKTSFFWFKKTRGFTTAHIACANSAPTERTPLFGWILT